MPLEEPSWWYRRPDAAIAKLLTPLGSLYGWAAQRRFRRASPYLSSLPVICIGNFTAGGTGKTPAALHVAGYLAAQGARPAFLSRGYGGSMQGPHWVNAATDTAAQVGDEPLLLARHAPVMIARDRAAGAKAIEAGDGRGGPAPNVIIMDDGLQNPALAKDLTLAIVDGSRGLGNCRVIPAGPLRAPLAFQLELADAIIVNQPAGGDHADGIGADLRRRFDGPVLDAAVAAVMDTDWLRTGPVLAFAGIGAPQRFFSLLDRIGAPLAGVEAFKDHHTFGEADAARLLSEADRLGARLVTTEKDMMRIEGAAAAGSALAELKARSRALAIKLSLEPREAGRLAALLDMAMRANR